MDELDFPEGTLVLESRTEFRVRICYREPTYASQSGSQDRNYRWTYRIAASSEEQAREMARAEFRKMEKLSSVGWARVITEVAVLD